MFTGTNKIGGLIDEDSEVYLNLTPMIDVLTCLLFFLLLSFGAIIIALINVTIPALSEGAEQQTEQEKTKKITITLQINNKSFIVSGDGDVSEQELKTLQKTLPLTPDGYDFQGLNDFLFDVKKRYQESDTAVIVTEPDIPYEILVKTLDATRERESMAEGKPVRIPLFPAPVVSSLVK